MTNPAELPGPDDAGSGGTWPGRIPKEIPQELPVFVASSLIREVIAVRNRLNAIENAAIIARLGRFGGLIGGPNELPNPDDPGGGGTFPGEIPFEIPFEIPQELPVDPSAVERLVDTRVNALRTEILAQLAEIRKLIESQRG